VLTDLAALASSCCVQACCRGEGSWRISWAEGRLFAVCLTCAQHVHVSPQGLVVAGSSCCTRDAKCQR
jgi:hypothetical protein